MNQNEKQIEGYKQEIQRLESIIWTMIEERKQLKAERDALLAELYETMEKVNNK